MVLSVALDIGGTFTDLIIIDESTGSMEHAKSSTTPLDLTIGIASQLDGILGTHGNTGSSPLA